MKKRPVKKPNDKTPAQTDDCVALTSQPVPLDAENNTNGGPKVRSIHQYADDDPLPDLQKANPHNSSPLVKVTLTPEVDKYAAGEQLDLMVSLEASAGVENAGPRPGLDLIVLVDVSASMKKQNKIRQAQKTLNFIIDSLGGNEYDRMSILTFQDVSQRLCRLLRVYEQKSSLHHYASQLHPKFGTNIMNGLALAFEVLRGRRQENHVSAIILLTDGRDNSTFERFEESYQRHGFDKVSMPIHTMAFGSDHDAQFLRKISERTLGTYSFIEDAETVSDAVAPVLGGLLSMIAKNTRITVTTDSLLWGLGVASGAYKSFYNRTNPVVRILSGDCYDGEVRKFLISGFPDEFPVRVNAEWSFVDPLSGEEAKDGTQVVVGAVDDDADVHRKHNHEVSEFKLTLMFKSALNDSLAAIHAHKYDRAKSIMMKVLSDIESYPFPVPEDFVQGLKEDISANLESVGMLGNSEPVVVPVDTGSGDLRPKAIPAERSNNSNTSNKRKKKMGVKKQRDDTTDFDLAGEDFGKAEAEMDVVEMKAATLQPSMQESSSKKSQDSKSFLEKLIAGMNAAQGEMEVQRAGYNALQKSKVSARFATKKQKSVQEEAKNYFENTE
eukprot:TRINITY_DN11779_c0_g1_i2.p1 TRINITY_DN11779_c0_g1~~TRINITY_DN11779_c0_g1_i2.p1  ORF type:complete len:692 (+),score=181.32 TRINITY_DN11779_c0_g1_i2:248-2077(+)